MVPDSHWKKWEDYPPHTKAKHAILVRYMKAWLSILGGGARAAGYRANLIVVDAFAGRGRYSTDDLGSPLLLRDLAGRVIADGRVDEAELFYIESDADNWAALTQELSSAEPPRGVRERLPYHDTFEHVAPGIIANAQQTDRSSFWFIDPFGYAGLPLPLIQRILDVSRAEVLVTLMVRDMNRFLDDSSHQRAISRVLNLAGDDLLSAIEGVKRSPRRIEALCNLYVERLEHSSRRRYVTSVGISRESAPDIIYYLIHATGHPKGKREIKEAIREATRGINAFLGASHPSSNEMQMGLFGDSEPLVNVPRLKSLLLERFMGRPIGFSPLLDETAASHDFDDYIDSDVKKALEELADSGTVRLYRDNRPSTRRLRDGDVIDFRTL